MRFCNCALPAMSPEGVNVCRNCNNNTDKSIASNLRYVYDTPKVNMEEWESLFFDKEVTEKFDEKGNIIERITKYVKRGERV